MNNTYLENIIFFYIIQHLDLVQAFKGSYFTNPILKQLFDIVKPHILEYKVEPTETQAINLVKAYGKDDKLTDDIVHTLWESRAMVTQYTDEWLSQNVKAFGEWQNLLSGVKRVIEYIKTVQADVTYENCSDIVQKVKSIFQADTNFTLNTEKGHDFFDPINHQQTELETRSSGYNFVDLCLKGGWANKTLNVFMGSPKVGKSMWLCNLCANSVKNGENSVYISLEMSYQLVAQRIGANLLNIPIDEYEKYSQDVNFMTAKMKEFYNTSLITPGTFIIEEFPTSSKTVYDIEAFLLKLEEERSTDEKPFKIKNVFLDYVNIMKDAKNPNSENMYQKIKSICEDLRAMAQRNQWAVISLTQTNRSAYDSSDIGMANVSESGGLIATVDSLFGIIQTPVMRAENVYYLKAVAIRNSGHMGDRKKFDFVQKYLRITENMDEPIIAENMSLPGTTNKTQNNNAYSHSNSFNSQNNISNQPTMMPQLGMTEQQLSAQALFETS